MSVGSSMAGEEQKGHPAAPVETRPAPGPASVTPGDKPAAASDSRDTPSDDVVEAAPTGEMQVTRAAEVPTGVAKRVSAPQPSLVDDVPALWTSVVNGDTHAEVTLASRYVRGEGVPQSCAQARVLLEAAVKRGNLEAKQKLDELGQAGCP
jgi:TPR repeat protein